MCATKFSAHIQQKTTRVALHSAILHAHNRKLNVLDCMLEKMEQYSNNLEQVIAQRTTELMEEKEKTDQLLYRMLPRCVYMQSR